MSVVEVSNILLAIVADGMGGMVNGDAASQAAVKAFVTSFQGKESGETVIDALQRSLLKANEEVFNLGVQMGAAEEMGTTLVAVAVDRTQAHEIRAGCQRRHLPAVRVDHAIFQHGSEIPLA